MTDLDALLSAVKANHAEDTPRLVLADWLDEHGQGERAEFIRVQIDLARMEADHRHRCVGTITGAMESSKLRRRERELWEANAPRWFSSDALGPFRRTIFPVMPEQGIRRIWERTAEELMSEPFFGQREAWSWYNGSSYIEVSASRGFISKVTCSSASWLAHGETILADPWTPWLDEVELMSWPEVIWGVVQSRNPEERFGEMLAFMRHRWPDVRKWTLPPGPVSLAVHRLQGIIRFPEDWADDTTPAAQDALLRMLTEGLAPSSPDLT